MNLFVLVGSLIVIWFDVSFYQKGWCKSLYTMSAYICIPFLVWISSPARRFTHRGLVKSSSCQRGEFDTYKYYERVTIISCIIHAAITTHYSFCGARSCFLSDEDFVGSVNSG